MHRRALIAGVGLAIIGVPAGAERTALEGEGRGVESVTFEAGVVVATIDLEDDQPVTVDLVSEDETHPRVVSGAGPVSVGGAVIQAGEYLLEVDTETAWSLTLEQPELTAVRDLPVSGSGTGSAWGGPVAFDGPAVVTGVHEEPDRFTVAIHGPEDRTEVVFRETQPFAGEAIVDLEGPGVVTVDATGEWEIGIE